MATPLNHGREYLALCASQLPAANVSPYLTLKPRTLAQAKADTGRDIFEAAKGFFSVSIAQEFPGEHGRGQF